MFYPTLANEWHFIVNPIMPLVAFGALLFQGWIVSSKLDKDARFFHFARVQWNIAHLIAGFVGFCITLTPVTEPWWFAVSFPLGLLVMLSTVFVYWGYRNRRVPEDQKFYLSTDRIRAAMQKRAAAKASAAAAISLVDSEGNSRIPPGKESEAFPVHIAMEQILTPAFLAGASRIELLPAKSGQYTVAQFVDTIRYRREPIDSTQANAVINYLKSHAGLDVKDMRRKQTGDMSAQLGTDTNELRARTSGSSQGQTLVLEINLKKRIDVKPEKLGFLPNQYERLDEAISDGSGIVLVAAPRGGGRTTALYALLRRHDAFTRNIRTLELEHLIQIDGVGHSEFKITEDGPDFATQLRSMLRRDPNIVMVSDLVDAQTAKEAATPGPKGPLIYLGLRAASGLEALAMWCKSVGELPEAAAPLRAVITGLLLRRLCENCKVPYSPPAEQLKKLGIPADHVKQLYKPSGKIIERNKEETCPVCAGLAYRGIVGSYEVLAFDDQARKLISKGDLNGLRSHTARLKTITLQQAALRKAIEGVTSIDEVIRATRARQPQQTQKNKAPAPARTQAPAQ